MKKIINAEIILNTAVSIDQFLMELKSSWLAKHAKPGQFVMVKIAENTTDPLLRIPLGIHSIKANGISLSYKVVGKGTKLLSAKTAGEKISILGPLGNGFTVKKKSHAILVAGGYGIVPLYCLAESLAKKNIQTSVYIGAASKKQIIYDDKFSILGADVHIATEDGSLGYRGKVTELLDAHLKAGKYNCVVIYASGPNLMLVALAKLSAEFNIPAQLSFEAYMGCGIGVCRGCAIETNDGYKMCCSDGPVFTGSDIDT